jgi:hypothetical protein
MDWAGGVVKVVEPLPSKSETLSSNPSATKKKLQRKWKNLKILKLIEAKTT